MDAESEVPSLLLREILVTIRRAGHTPLQSRIDSLSLVRAAEARLRPRLRAPWAAPGELIPRLAARVREALSPAPPRAAEAAGGPPEGPEPPPAPEAWLVPLAAWLERLYTALRSVDPRAIEILGLRLEGCDDREIADRLELGLRLVRGVVRDLDGAARGAGAA